MLGRIMVNTSLPRHPKLFALAAEVRVTPPLALGYLVAIWCEVMAQKEGGVLEGWARGDLERVSGWKGKAGLLASGLVKTGWIDDLGNGTYAIHDWGENQGNILEDRKYDAWRKRVERAHKRGTHLSECPNVCRTSEGRPQDISVPLPPLPIPSSPIPPQPEEKRGGARAPDAPPLPDGREVRPEDGQDEPEEGRPAPPDHAPDGFIKTAEGLFQSVKAQSGKNGALHQQDEKRLPEANGAAPMLPGTTEGHLFALAKRQCIQAKDETLRTYLRGWIRQRGPAEVERILMEPRVVGKGIIAIQDWYFNDMAGTGFTGKVK